MFRCVIVINENGSVKIDRIDPNGKMVEAEVYDGLEDIPTDIQLKLRQLMWTPPNDSHLVRDLGLRIGDNIYWIHETGE